MSYIFKLHFETTFQIEFSRCARNDSIRCGGRISVAQVLCKLEHSCGDGAGVGEIALSAAT